MEYKVSMVDRRPEGRVDVEVEGKALFKQRNDAEVGKGFEKKFEGKEVKMQNGTEMTGKP
jgi:hypothetical protein